MEKQHNRGQDGAGLANIKFDMPPGQRYISRMRSNSNRPIIDVFEQVNARFKEIEAQPDLINDVEYLKANYGFTGELFLGHLRYGTFGKNSIESIHPFLRQNNWMTRNLVVAGNFNLTNVDELFSQLVDLGQYPKEKADTVTVMEKIGHFLDSENDRLFRIYKDQGYSNQQITSLIAKNMNIGDILRRSSDKWDGGYAMAGLIGHGDAFVLRDPSGIRPAFWYEDDEVVVVASERPVIQTAFKVKVEDVHELTPGCAIIIRKDNRVDVEEIIPPLERQACSFERIYFSRGSDVDIYKERKELGRLVVPSVLKAVNNDLDHTVFSFIPNTAETAFLGMVKGLEDYLDGWKHEQISNGGQQLSSEALKKVLAVRPRVEKIAIKDAKLRTFITQDDARDDMVAHVYDVTYGTIECKVDSLVVIDDSIVRGTTLKKSIIKMLDRLEPKHIVIVSSAPQIRYPDCYGIDMAKMGDFIAFQAAVSLLKKTGKGELLQLVYRKCKEQEGLPKEQVKNYVREIYAPFTADEISAEISFLLAPEDVKAKVTILYQTIEDLHSACPGNKGDWYFTGKYPTPGGNAVVNRAFINYMEGRNERAY